MKIFLFSGGLGNQIFQVYEFIINNEKYTHYSTLLFNKRALKFLRKFYFPNNHFKKLNFVFAKALFILTKFKFLNINSDVPYLQSNTVSKSKISFTNGYFQKSFNNSELEILKDILKQFSIIDNPSCYPENNILIHIRRADYIEIGEDLKLEYYIDAINYFKNEITHPKFFILTNDKSWVENNILPIVEYKYIDLGDARLVLNEMIKFKNIILSNSTLSYWGYMLNMNKDKTATVPNPWFRNRNLPLYLEDLKTGKQIKNQLYS